MQHLLVKTFEHFRSMCEDECAICLSTINKENNFWVTPCKHKFHGTCLMKWYVSNQSCPVCRTELGLGMVGNEEVLLNQMELTTFRWRTESKSLGLIMASPRIFKTVEEYTIERFTGLILDATVLGLERRELILVAQDLKCPMKCGVCSMWGHTRRHESCPKRT